MADLGPGVSDAGNVRSGPRASFWLRLAAAFIDVVLLVGIREISRAIFGILLGGAVSVLVDLAYYAYLEGSPSGQTLGKRAMSIRVIDFAGAGPIGPGRALIRYIGRIVSAIPLGLGYWWMLWDPQKQTWHDKFATTVVVPTSAYPVADWPG